jgi:hypothetical protein
MFWIASWCVVLWDQWQMIRIPEDGYPNILAMTFFIGIFAHYVIYVIGITMLRTLSFSLAALSTLALGLRVLGFI